MKNPIPSFIGNCNVFLLLLISIVTCFEANAMHLPGAEIEYENIGIRQWRIRLIVYAYCEPNMTSLCGTNGCTKVMFAEPSPEVSNGGLNLLTCSGSVPVYVSLVKVEDVNKRAIAICGQSAKNGCTNLGTVSGGPYRPSIERYTFEGVLNLSSVIPSNACKYWDVKMYECCRGDAGNIDGSQEFLLKATINIADNGNNSPILKNEAVLVVSPTQQTTFNLGAADPDRDSLSYAIVKGFKNPIALVTYNAPYNEKYPFPLNEQMPPHNTTYPFVVIDPVRGDVSFNAKNITTQTIIGNLCIQVTQWRYKEQPLGSGIRVPYISGITTRDWNIHVVPTPFNDLPSIITNPALSNGQPKFDWTVCAGEQICFTVTAQDINADSTWLSWSKAINKPSNKLTFQPDYDTAAIPSQRPREDRWKFCWQTEVTDTSSYPYYFTVYGNDNRCPRIGTTMSTFSVRVFPRAEADLLKTSPGCSKWHLQVRKTNGLQSFSAARIEIAKAPFDYTFANGKTTINSSNPNPAGTGSGPRAIIQDSIQFTQPGKYLIKYFATTSVTGCEATYTDTIVVGGTPLNIQLEDTVKCKFTDIVLVANASAGVPPYQYRWNNNSLPTPVFNDSLVVRNNATTVYQLEVKDSAGCSLLKPVTVNVKLLPQSVIVANASQQCLEGNNFKFSHLPITAFQNYTRTWLYENQISADSSFHISYATTGIKIVKLVIVEPNGCLDTAVKNVTVVVVPVVDNVIMVNDSIQCLQGNAFIYSKATLPNHSYKWLLDNGGSSTNVNWGQAYTSAGIKTMRLEIKNQQGCIDTAERTVLVTSKPSAGTFTVNDTFQCVAGNLFTFKHSSVAELTYKWLYDNKTSTDSSVNYTFGSSGTKTIRLTATEIGGCVDTVSKAVIVSAKPIIADLIYVKDSIQCITGNEFEISYYLRNNRQIFNHTWFVDEIQSDSLVLKHSYSSPGTKQLKLLVEQNGGCADTAKRSVVVGMAPVMNNIIQVNDSIQCINKNSFLFSYNSSNNPQVFKYAWLKDGISSITPTLTATYPTTGFKEVKLIVSQDKACRDTATQKIEVAPRPVVQSVIEVNDSIQCLSNNKFMLDYKRPAATHDYFTWRIEGTDFFSSPLLHEFQSPGIKQVRLVLVNDAGCADSAIKSLIVKPSPSPAIIQGPVNNLTTQNAYEYNIGLQQTSHSYKWYASNGSFMQGDDSVVVRLKWLTSGPGSLKVEQTLDGCTDVDSVSVTIGSVGLKNIAPLQNIFVKPNPNRGVFTIGLESIKAQHVQATLHNVLGELVWSDEKNIGIGLNELEVSVNVPDGIYLLTVYDQQSKNVKRVLINR